MQSARKTMIFYYSFLGIGLLFLLICCGLYFYNFPCNLSSESKDWADFGKYVGGVSGVVNIMIFIGISLILKNIESNTKEAELNVNRKISVFERFLDNCEEIVKNLVDLKIEFKNMSYGDKNRHLSSILLLYKYILQLKVVLDSYVLDDDIVSFSGLIDSFAAFYNSVELGKEEDLFIKNRDKVVAEIDILLNKVSKLIRNNISKKIMIENGN